MPHRRPDAKEGTVTFQPKPYINYTLTNLARVELDTPHVIVHEHREVLRRRTTFELVELPSDRTLVARVVDDWDLAEQGSIDKGKRDLVLRMCQEWRESSEARGD